MEFNKEKYIIKLLDDNSKGVDLETIIDYLDYINKVRYKKDDIEKVLKRLILENKIIMKGDLYKK